MIVVPLEPIPTQSLNVDIDDDNYELLFRDIGGAMTVDISRNNEPLVQGRILTRGGLIPYRHLTRGGNFFFSTESGDIPTWKKFSTRQFLIWATDEEIDEFS